MDIQTATPAEIDAEIARIDREMAAQRANMDWARRHIDFARQSPFPDQAEIGKFLRQLEGATLAMNRLDDEQAPFRAEFRRRGGWTRYYLVDAYNGHVHRDYSNSRCSRTWGTVHVWLTDQSGMAREDLVAMAGERACTVCFPDAPVDVLRRPSQFTPPSAAEKEARAVERRQRAEEKKAKQITNPDGSPLVVKYQGFPERPSTLTAAKALAMRIEFNALAYGDTIGDAGRAALGTLFAAIAAKTQSSVDSVKADHEARLIKKCRREEIAYRSERR